MTVTVEEMVAEGWLEEQQNAHWEHDNHGMQKHWFRGRSFDLTRRSVHQWWLLRDVHAFCLKICAIYRTVNSDVGQELCSYLWDKWFQPGVSPCRFENFFGRYIASHHPESPKSIPELRDAHRDICAQVLLRQVTLTAEDKPLKPPRQYDLGTRVDDRYENHENYRLEALFHALFIVMDTPVHRAHKRSGEEQKQADEEIIANASVLIVRTGEYHDLRTGPVDFAPIDNMSEQVDENGDVRRIALGDAVDFVLELHKQNTEVFD
ncbi:MAG: hypothetical protein LQ346_006673 [Caloplaca aetnensis]|nr:MAG: hypothetical protein LQ346_006673 [Caloplaca aetnensis]